MSVKNGDDHRLLEMSWSMKQGKAQDQRREEVLIRIRTIYDV